MASTSKKSLRLTPQPLPILKKSKVVFLHSKLRMKKSPYIDVYLGRYFQLFHAGGLVEKIFPGWSQSATPL